MTKEQLENKLRNEGLSEEEKKRVERIVGEVAGKMVSTDDLVNFIPRVGYNLGEKCASHFTDSEKAIRFGKGVGTVAGYCAMVSIADYVLGDNAAGRILCCLIAVGSPYLAIYGDRCRDYLKKQEEK